MAVDDMLIKLAKAFSKTKLQTVFLINNYDMTISILKVWISIYVFFMSKTRSLMNQATYSVLDPSSRLSLRDIALLHT